MPLSLKSSKIFIIFSNFFVLLLFSILYCIKKTSESDFGLFSEVGNILWLETYVKLFRAMHQLLLMLLYSASVLKGSSKRLLTPMRAYDGTQ